MPYIYTVVFQNNRTLKMDQMILASENDIGCVWNAFKQAYPEYLPMRIARGAYSYPPDLLERFFEMYKESFRTH